MFKGQQPLGQSSEGLNLLSGCPVCQHKYEPVQMRILEEKDASHFVYIKCNQCQVGVQAMLINGGLGITSVGLITDLSAEDVLKYKEAQAIGVDDVLGFHELLEQKDNDYLKIFLD